MHAGKVSRYAEGQSTLNGSPFFYRKPHVYDFGGAMARNGTTRCFSAKDGSTLKTIAAESFVGRI